MASKPEGPAKPLFAPERAPVKRLFADSPAPPPTADVHSPPPQVRPLDLPSRQPEAPPAPSPAVPPVKALVLPDPVPLKETQYAPASLVFDDGKGSAVEQLKRAAIAALPGLTAQQLTVLDQAIRELLPLDLSNLAAWGDSLLRDTEAISNELQRLTAAVAGWNAGEVIDQCNQAMAAAGLWKMFAKSPSALKPALELILTQARPTLTTLDELANRLPEGRDRFAVSLLLQKLVPRLASLREVEAESFSRRGYLLALSAQQFDLLAPQIEQMKRQVVAWQSEIEQLLRVTLPVWELANSRKDR